MGGEHGSKSTQNKCAQKTCPLTLKGSKLEDFLPLLPAEEKLRQCAANGEVCEVDDFSGERPEEATEFNSVRAEFLRYMILGGCERSLVHTRGINLFGAYIFLQQNTTIIDLQSVTINFDISLLCCSIIHNIDLRGATIKSLFLNGSSLEELIADRVSAEGVIFLANEFRAKGEVRLLGAKIRSSLNCTSGNFNNPTNALSCDGIGVNGGIFLNDNFKAIGVARLLGAKIYGDLTCEGGYFQSGILANNMTVEENIDCNDGKLSDSDISLIANRAK